MTYAVRFEQVSKQYPRGGPRYPSLRQDVMTRVGAALTRRRVPPSGTLALRDVSFEVSEGQSFALIGPNGAGKTTALKLISRISYPTGGRVSVRGTVGALIEVGSGVHPELTARENIRLYGQILGMSRRDVGRRFDEIVDFAELGHVLDTPVKMYSSGMQLRLGFAIASHLDPDVFVVDEALAVGDAGFQSKCVERMSKLVREGRTLIFVSHNLPAVETLCDSAVLVDRGRVRDSGSARDILAKYLSWMEENTEHGENLWAGSRDGLIHLLSATCHGLDGEERYRFRPGEGVEVRLRLECRERVSRPHVNLGITDGRPGLLVHCSMLTDGRVPDSVEGMWECRCRIASLPLRPRLYQVFADVYDSSGHGTIMDWSQVSAFRMIGPPGEGPLAVVNAALTGAVDVPYLWEIRTAPSPDLPVPNE